MTVLDRSYWITRAFTIHPEGDMTVWTKFHGNPSNSCWDISLKTKLLTFIIWESWVSVQHILTSHAIAAEMVCTKVVDQQATVLPNSLTSIHQKADVTVMQLCTYNITFKVVQNLLMQYTYLKLEIILGFQFKIRSAGGEREWTVTWEFVGIKTLLCE